MNSLNSTLIEGNLVRDPILATTPKGTEVCNFSIATDRFYKVNGDEDYTKEVSFFDVEAWAKLAARAAELTKGRSIRVVGRLRQDRWTDDQGQAHARVKIVAEHIEIRPSYAKPPVESAEA